MTGKRSYTGQCWRGLPKPHVGASFLSEMAVRKSVVRHTLFSYNPDMLIGVTIEGNVIRLHRLDAS